MDDGIKIELFGIEALQSYFDSLSNFDQSKIIMDAYREGTKPVLLLVKQVLRSKLISHSKRGNLEKSIGFVPGKIKRGSVWVSAKIGARRFGIYRGFHGHLYDAGTVQRQTKRGFNRGEMPATGFFSETINQQTAQITENITDSMLTALDKHIKQKASKFARDYDKAHGN